MYPISVIIALGSNIGNYKINFHNAIELISKFGQIKSIGNIYVSKPYGLNEQNNFFNAAIEILTAFALAQLGYVFYKSKNIY